MCGRFVASTPVSELAELLDAGQVSAESPDGTGGPDGDTPLSWNVAPQAAVWALTAKENEEGEVVRRLRRYHWGLVPHWSKGPSSGARAFNARAESVLEKPMFATAFARRRCIVPADAFYEWARSPGAGGRPVRRQPWCFRAADGGLLGFAGLWEYWRERPSGSGEEDPEARMLRSCTIITTSANSLVAPIHDRMPVILASEAWDEWLSVGPLPSAELADLLTPARDGALVGFTVSTRVNDGRIDDPGLADPVDTEGGGATGDGATGGGAGRAGGSGTKRAAVPAATEQSLFEVLPAGDPAGRRS